MARGGSAQPRRTAGFDSCRRRYPNGWRLKKPAVLRPPAFLIRDIAAYTLTSGPLEAGPFDPPLGPLGFGLRGGLRLRAPGSFSGFGVNGPSTYSKPIF